MKRLISLAVIFSLVVTVQAGVIFTKKVKSDRDFILAIADTLHNTWVTADAISAEVVDEIGWNTTGGVVAKNYVDTYWKSEVKHDSLKEYVSSIDTVVELYEVVCDTLGSKIIPRTIIHQSIPPDTVTIDFIGWDSIVCDTIYRIHYVDVWSYKTEVYVTPDEYKKLMEWLR